jgi:hypothetical protein
MDATTGRDDKMIQALIGPATELIGKFIEDKDKKNQLAHELATMADRHMAEAMAANAQANVEQAKHSSIFVAGARPAIMWVCCLGLLTNFFLMPLAEWAVLVFAPGTVLLMTLTLSLLGLGGMRSWEKSKGVARKTMKD